MYVSSARYSSQNLARVDSPRRSSEEGRSVGWSLFSILDPLSKRTDENFWKALNGPPVGRSSVPKCVGLRSSDVRR